MAVNCHSRPSFRPFSAETRRRACALEARPARPDAVPDHAGTDGGGHHLLPRGALHGLPAPQQMSLPACPPAHPPTSAHGESLCSFIASVCSFSLPLWYLDRVQRGRGCSRVWIDPRPHVSQPRLQHSELPLCSTASSLSELFHAWRCWFVCETFWACPSSTMEMM